MQYKFVVFFFFFAACSASLLGTNNILVAFRGSNIVVSNDLGTQVNLALNPLSAVGGLGWSQGIQIQVAGPGVIPQAIQIPDQPAGTAGQSQSAILYQILSQFSGILDEVTYEQLLTVIAQFVQFGQISPSILNALQVVDISSQSIALTDTTLSQIASSQGPQGWYGQAPYNSWWSVGSSGSPQWSSVNYGRPTWTGIGIGVGAGWPQQSAGAQCPCGKVWSQGNWNAGNWWPSSNIWARWQGGIPLGQQTLIPVVA